MTNFHYNPDLVFNRCDKHFIFRDPVRKVTALILINDPYVSAHYYGVNYLPEGVLTRDGVPRELVRVMAIHAEKDAIIQALKYHHYTELEGATMYVSLAPCAACRELLALFKIKDCYFAEHYIPSDSGASK